MSYTTDKLEKIFSLIEKIFYNMFDTFIKGNKYYPLYQKEIDILYRELFINNIHNLINIYGDKRQNTNFIKNDLISLGNYSYSTNKAGKESFRMVFPFLSSYTFYNNINLITSLGFNINKENKQLLFNYIDKNPNIYYNLGFSFGKEIKLGAKIFFNCSIKEIELFFPDLYKNLFKIFPNINNEDYLKKTLFGIDFNKDGTLNNFKLYGDYKFLKEKITRTLPSKYNYIYNNPNNNYIFKYVLRMDIKGNISYKINMINTKDKDIQSTLKNYFPNIQDKFPLEIIGFSFSGSNPPDINKVDCYFTF